MNRYDQIKAVVADRIPFSYVRVLEEAVDGRPYVAIELYDTYAQQLHRSWAYDSFERCLRVLSLAVGSMSNTVGT